MIGPCITMLCSLAPGKEIDGLLFNSSTLTFWCATVLSSIRLPLLIFCFDEQVFSDVKKLPSPDNSEHSKSSSPGVWRWLLLFASTVFLFNVSNGVLTLCFQPLMVNEYKFDQLKIAAVMFLIIIVSLIPISIMAFLGKRGVQDRWFLLVGLGGALIPVTLFGWPSGSAWTVVLGGVLTIPFTTLILPSCNTLFSKKVGTENASGLKVGLLVASLSLGQATGDALGIQALPMYGTYTFLVWGLFLGTGLLLIACAFPWLSLPQSSKTVSINESATERSSLLNHKRETVGSHEVHSNSSKR